MFILPDNASQGSIEDLLLESAEKTWPETLPLARKFVATAGATLSQTDRRELLKPAGVNKATAASIGNLLRPGKAIQVSIEDNDWFTPDSPRRQSLQSFLHRLAGLTSD